MIWKAYEMLTGHSADGISDEECIRVVMEQWDSQTFRANSTSEEIGRMALCQIGVCWTPDAPYEFKLITDRLREIWRALGDTPIPQRRMALLWYQYHRQHGATI